MYKVIANLEVGSQRFRKKVSKNKTLATILDLRHFPWSQQRLGKVIVNLLGHSKLLKIVKVQEV